MRVPVPAPSPRRRAAHGPLGASRAPWGDHGTRPARFRVTAPPPCRFALRGIRHAAPDLVDGLPPGLGTVSSTLALANDSALIGLPFYAQTIPSEFDLTGAIAALRASNALALGIGSW